jgi:phospholipid/cholesterol/gamma-HCH transport system ATP-binding protein
MNTETKYSTEPPVKKSWADDERAIEIKHLRKSFGNNQVLKDVNLNLNKGENVVVLGRSGSGKSVLIKCIIGLLEPDEGELLVLGKRISELKNKEMNELRKKVGFLFQSAALYDSMTVRENLEFPLRGTHFSKKNELDEMVMEALENVGLKKAIDKMPSELSGGMRKRVGLARTLMLKPEIMLYDEPTTGLDPITSREISVLITEVQKKQGTASIIITHDIACAKLTADRLIVLKNGIFEAEGTYEELERSEDEWVRSFFI